MIVITKFKFPILKHLTWVIPIHCLIIIGCEANTNKDHKVNERSCVDKVIKIDDSLGTIRNHATKDISLSQAIDEYTNKLSSVSFEGCPDRFTKAFQSHIRAWGNMNEVTDKHDQLRGEMHTLFDSIALSPDSAKFNHHLSKIWSTWSEVDAAMK